MSDESIKIGVLLLHIGRSRRSPLPSYAQAFARRLQEKLGANYSVKIAFLPGKPNIERALREFVEEEAQTLILAPMYPQYASATRGKLLDEMDHLMGRLGIEIPTECVPPFYAEAAFIESCANVIRQNLKGATPEHLIFSFHGIPERQLRKVPGCLRNDFCCFEKYACQKNCYRAQCFDSATHIAEELGLQDSHWSVAFHPSMEHTLQVLAQTNRQSIAVFCPSLVTDCLETLEDLGIDGQDFFKHQGGIKFSLIPCLNSNDDWITQFANLIKELKITIVAPEWPSLDHSTPSRAPQRPQPFH